MKTGDTFCAPSCCFGFWQRRMGMPKTSPSLFYPVVVTV